MSVVSAINQNQEFSLVNSRELLGKDDFLKLLITQLQYQDPINPMENTEFIAQLAQFSSLEQMKNVDNGIQDLSLMMQSINNSMATSMIGKEVKFVGDTLYLPNEGEVKINYELAETADVEIKIYDEDDSLVATLKPGEQLGGEQVVTWDGKDDNGNPLSSGSYRFEIEAKDSDGNLVSVISYARDRIRGLRFENGNAILLLNKDEIYLSDIIEILE